MASIHILEISVPRVKSQFNRRITLQFSSQKLTYYSLSSKHLNSKDRVTYSENMNMQIRVREINFNQSFQVYRKEKFRLQAERTSGKAKRAMTKPGPEV